MNTRKKIQELEIPTNPVQDENIKFWVLNAVIKINELIQAWNSEGEPRILASGEADLETGEVRFDAPQETKDKMTRIGTIYGVDIFADTVDTKTTGLINRYLEEQMQGIKNDLEEEIENFIKQNK